MHWCEIGVYFIFPQFMTSFWNKLFLSVPEWVAVYYSPKSFYILLALIAEHGKSKVESFTVKIAV